MEVYDPGSRRLCRALQLLLPIVLAALVACGSSDDDPDHPLDLVSAPPPLNDSGAEAAPWVVASPPETEDNRPPVAEAGGDRLIRVGTLVGLDASASRDPDGNPLTFDWAVLAQPVGSSISFSGADTATPSFIPPVTGDYLIRLTVSDGQGGVASTRITLTAVAPGININPVARAAAPPAAVLNALVVLDGSASYDPDNELLFFSWTFAGRPSGSFAILSANQTATAYFIPDVAGDYRLVLTVRDQLGASSADTVVVRALPAGANHPPVADAGADLLIQIGSRVVLNGGASFDPEGLPLEYDWELFPWPGRVITLEGADTVTPTFTAGTAGDYQLRLTVYDPFGASDTDYVTVRVR
ncbi:MAG: hypothetical protein IH614_08745 [Desulfuromonadales bacterium]|nr:hypothetical protein [Desulfuromonadales bacterium]